MRIAGLKTRISMLLTFVIDEQTYGLLGGRGIRTITYVLHRAELVHAVDKVGGAAAAAASNYGYCDFVTNTTSASQRRRTVRCAVP